MSTLNIRVKLNIIVGYSNLELSNNHHKGQQKEKRRVAK